MEKAKETGTDQELMRSMKVSKAVAAMAIPSVISSLVTVVYNMADTFFVGQTGDALQVAAVSLTNPIFILLMAFANMFGMGGSAVASMAMGEGFPIPKQEMAAAPVSKPKQSVISFPCASKKNPLNTPSSKK